MTGVKKNFLKLTLDKSHFITGGESSGCFAESIEDALDVADRMAEETTERYTHEEVFAKWKEK